MENRCVLASVSGTVIDDLDGQIDPDDPGMGGVSVFIDANANGALDIAGSVVEPDDFGEDNQIEQPGVTFSLADGSNNIQEGVQIVARRHPDASTGDLVFGTDQRTHFAFEERLRVDFDTPVNSVTIDFIGSRPLPTDVGTLEIYSSDGTLLDSSDSAGLAEGNYQSLRLARAEGDIAYATAFTKRENGLTGRLDALRINDAGSEISTLTNRDGEYHIQNLPAGPHLVTQVVPADYVQSSPENGAPNGVMLGENQDAVDLDFVNTPIPGSWHNADNPLDVDNDGLIVAFDALLIINELNEPKYRDLDTGELPVPPPNPVPAFFDVTNDGFVAPGDVLPIINHLNEPANAVAEGEHNLFHSSTAPSQADASLANTSLVAAAVDELTILGDLSTSVRSEAVTVIDLSMDAEPISQFVDILSLDELEKVFDADEHRGAAVDTSMVPEIELDDAVVFLLARDLLSS